MAEWSKAEPVHEVINRNFKSIPTRTGGASLILPQQMSSPPRSVIVQLLNVSDRWSIEWGDVLIVRDHNGKSLNYWMSPNFVNMEQLMLLWALHTVDRGLCSKQPQLCLCLTVKWNCRKFEKKIVCLYQKTCEWINFRSWNGHFEQNRRWVEVAKRRQKPPVQMV